MNELNVRNVLLAKNPGGFNRVPQPLLRLIIKTVEKVLHTRKLNDFLTRNDRHRGMAFIDALFESLDFSYSLSHRDRQKIPAEGKLIVVANHPLGALDGLALLKAIHEVRPEVKIIANDVLMQVENLAELFLPFDIFGNKMQKRHIADISRAVQQEQAVIFFPAAEVSRPTWKGIRDGRWLKGPVFFAQKHEATVLPVYIRGRNSFFFYALSVLSKKASMFLLPGEIQKQRRKNILFKIGHPIGGKIFSSSFVDAKTQSRLLRKHVYAIGKGKRGIFKTERTIIHPTDCRAIKKELLDARCLGVTSDGKQILLVEQARAPHVLTEIGRLREATFRRIGEGTGAKIDLDRFDAYYQHIVLWDEAALEIVGSYRIGVCKSILLNHGPNGLYTSTLFNYAESALPILQQALELGRSFVQERYWKGQALDYLWQGIGAYLAFHPEVKYLLGPVSISANYSEEARNQLVYFYQKWFGDPSGLALHKNQYLLSRNTIAELKPVFSSIDYRQELHRLKESLKMLGFSIPVLYKQYTELCEEGGCKFLGFGVDRDFGNCVDGLILINLDRLKPAKKSRYLKRYSDYDQVQNILKNQIVNNN
jgi:putative hemolysin